MISPQQVHAYGVDFMSSADILAYFKEYGPRFVEWLDDSVGGGRRGGVCEGVRGGV